MYLGSIKCIIFILIFIFVKLQNPNFDLKSHELNVDVIKFEYLLLESSYASGQEPRS